MRALVIGRGSMGRRRIRDLTALGVEVESWDKTDAVTMTGASFDAIIVATPPKTKWEYVAMAAVRSIPCFTEADVVSLTTGPIPSVRFPSATPLFTDWYPPTQPLPGLKTYTLRVGQHLDDWHPGADPATYYAYQGDIAIREMIPFELIWLSKMFGPVSRATGRIETREARIMTFHDSGVVGYVHIETLSRPPIRLFTTAGEKWKKQSVLTYSEETYLREMRALVAAVKGESPWPYSQAEEAANLEVLHTIERSG